MFLVDLRVASEMSCPYNDYCGWGIHCYRDYKFASVTLEAFDWPVISDCFPGDSASASCWILNSQQCARYRWYLKPSYYETYEVRDIGTPQCKPYLLITQQANGSRPVSQEIMGAYSSYGIH